MRNNVHFEMHQQMAMLCTEESFNERGIPLLITINTGTQKRQKNTKNNANINTNHFTQWKTNRSQSFTKPKKAKLN